VSRFLVHFPFNSLKSAITAVLKAAFLTLTGSFAILHLLFLKSQEVYFAGNKISDKRSKKNKEKTLEDGLIQDPFENPQ